MNLSRLLLAALAASALSVPAIAQQSLEELLAFTADIVGTAHADTLVRLAIGPEIIAATRPDLSDLRVLDENGREIPYLVDSGERRNVRVTRRVEAEILGVQRDLSEQEGELPVAIETYELSVPDPSETAEPQGSPSWDLVVEVARSRFVLELDVELESGGQRSRLLSGTSLFRLESPVAERLRAHVGQLGASDASDASDQVLRATVRSRESSFLEPSFYFEQVQSVERQQTRLRVELEIVERRTERSETIVVVSRPAGLVPDALELAASNLSFQRQLTVRDLGPLGGGRTLGSGRLLRLGRQTPRTERLEVQLSGHARGERLELRFVDLDAPPLEQIAVFALRIRPSLLFVLPAGGGRLFFGGKRAHRPRYDLSVLRDALALDPGVRALEGVDVELTEALLGAELPEVELGEIVDNPSYDDRPALAFAMRAGAELDTRSFSHQRAVEIPDTRDGLIRLRLEPADLAHAQSSLSDLRVVDAQARQWPFLIHRPSRSIRRPLEVAQESEEGVTSYALSLGADAFVVERLELDFQEPFFDRDHHLECLDADGLVRELSQGRLVRSAHATPTPLFVSVPESSCAGLVLAVRDGDDAPLTTVGVWGYLQLPELLLAAPGGRYRLLLGNPEIASPSYELARARDLVLGVRSEAVETDVLEVNLDFSKRSRLGRSQNLERLGLLAVVAIAALVLGVITWRTLAPTGAKDPNG